jgi:hypothetical protein
MERGTYKYRTLLGNTIVFEVGGSMTSCRAENPEGDWLYHYGSVTPPEVRVQDGQTIVVFTELPSQRLRGVAIRPVITLG